MQVPDDICRRAAEMSVRYITDRFLPDKAIDLIDEACSRLNLDSPQLSEIPALQTEIEGLQTQLDLLTQSSARDEQEDTYARIASCRQRLLQVEGRLHELLCKPAPTVDEQLLASVIELWDRHPGRQGRGQGVRASARHGGTPQEPCHRTGRSRGRGLRVHPPLARGHQP